MCPKPWHRDTVCRLNVRALTAAPNRSERLKTPVFQPGIPIQIPVAPSLLSTAARSI